MDSQSQSRSTPRITRSLSQQPQVNGSTSAPSLARGSSFPSEVSSPTPPTSPSTSPSSNALNDTLVLTDSEDDPLLHHVDDDYMIDHSDDEENGGYQRDWSSFYGSFVVRPPPPKAPRLSDGTVVMPNLLEGVNIPAGPARTGEECCVCLDPPLHPVTLPCGHTFCFLCAKVRSVDKVGLRHCSNLRCVGTDPAGCWRWRMLQFVSPGDPSWIPQAGDRPHRCRGRHRHRDCRHWAGDGLVL